LALATALLAAPLGAAAQDPPADANREAEEDKRYLEGAEERVIQTTDGVYLSVHLWIPKNANKELPVVVLMHMRGRSQRDWFPFAKYLSENGFAACTFDFRGHGESRDVDPTIYKPPAAAMKLAEARGSGPDERVVPQGSRELLKPPPSAERTEKINERDEFRTGRELAFALVEDVRTIKEFLLTRHNDGQFNIRRLGMVGAELGAMIAQQWMQEDEFRVGRLQGWSRRDGDLAALVLVSPMTNYWGQKMADNFNDLGQELPIMIVSGSGKAAEEAGRVARKLRVPERPLGESGDKDKGPRIKPRGKERPNSGLFKVKSDLVGTNLLRPPVERLDQYIGGFLLRNLSGDKARNWERRAVDPDRAGFGSG
jgi:alpha-beta hydrolase superfamily lysophospholipase